MASNVYLSWQQVRELSEALGHRITIAHPDGVPIKVWGIPRGGGYVASLLDNRHYGNGYLFQAVEEPHWATVAVDDIIDSGRTAAMVKEKYGLETYALINKVGEPSRWANQWFIFPWEGKDGKQEDGESVITRMIELIGEDAARPGLAETPERVVRSWGELYAGYQYTNDDLKAMLKMFPAHGYRDMVFVRDIPFFSTCEHHLLPFYGHATVAYLPNGEEIIGLSKIPRVVNLLSRRLQVQETLAQDICDILGSVSNGAAAALKGVHFCLTARGQSIQGASFETTGASGLFCERTHTWMEFANRI